MNVELSRDEFRLLLDLVYIGNWVLNSTRTTDPLKEYEQLQEKMFSLCAENNMRSLAEKWSGHYFPSRAYEEGGIHDAIQKYEDDIFFDDLAEELARRDLGEDEGNYELLCKRIDEYMDEFEENGVENLVLDV